MEVDAEFRRLVKDALEHLYDTATLETHPLLARFPAEAAETRRTRAQRLRGLLKETIEALRPQEGSPSGSPEWRSYLALRYRFVQGMSPGEVESELGISLRQLQRELHKGLDAATALLWERRTRAMPSLPADEGQSLQDELSRWEISRQICPVQALVDDTLWMCRPLLEERGLSLEREYPPDLTPVYVDATLTRQALYKLLRVLARNTPPGKLHLHAQAEADQVVLILQGAARVRMDAEVDWQAARLICEQQGHRLEVKTLPGHRTAVLLALPCASQPRVLVVDDNAAIHQLFERYLAPQHYAVLHAHNGPQALELAAQERPDAITLDVMMPNVDGWQVLRALTGSPATAAIPVLICSVLKEPALAYALGARAYLKKPVDRLELIATLGRLLAPAARGGGEPPPTPGDS